MRRFRGCQPVVVSLKNSLKYKYLRKTWPMQVWIPVVSWSLYFWKSVFSFRAGSILKVDGGFISKWKFPDCVHFFGAWARQAAIETVAVVYEHTKRTQETCIIVLLGTIIQSIFLCPIRSQHPLEFWKWSGESRYPGALSRVLENFRPAFLPTRLTAPGSPMKNAKRENNECSRNGEKTNLHKNKIAVFWV